MIICACDPDTQTPAFAVYAGKHIIYWDCLITRKEHWISQVATIIGRHEPELLVIEAQFIPPSKEGIRRFKSIAELCAARGAIQAIFLLHGIRSVLAQPFEWQQSLGGSRCGRDALKRLSQLKASDITGTPIENINTADAICIGDWWAKTQMRTYEKELKHAASHARR